MKKLFAMLLTLALALGLVCPALAAQAVTPTPPEWINGEDYLIFPGDEVYQPENWAKVEALREEARNGALLSDDTERNVEDSSPGMCYEIALVRVKYALNAGGDTEEGRKAFDFASGAFGSAWRGWYAWCGDEKDMLYYRLYVEAGRARAIYTSYNALGWKTGMMPALKTLNMTTEDFFAGQYMYLVTPETKSEIIAAMEAIELVLDGRAMHLDVPLEVKNQRTMVPIRAVAEAIGADVEWVQDKQQAVLTRAGSTVTMTLNSTTADVDGKKVEMDVAPYAVNGRTLLPARYVAEFFGQKVEWDGKQYKVLISEDKSAAGNSNMEKWALPMGAMLSYMNSKSPHYFGDPYPRTGTSAKSSRDILQRSWSIESRESLINTVVSMTFYGHDATFREMAADVKLRTPEERAEISAASDAWPGYMWEYTEQVDKKWGDRGIMAWDLFRMSNLVQWGYTAGYVTYEEALILLEPAAEILCENFSSWDEAYENYLDGYNWWARNDVLGKDIWETDRGRFYRNMQGDKEIAPIFDDTLFETGVIGLPDQER